MPGRHVFIKCWVFPYDIVRELPGRKVPIGDGRHVVRELRGGFILGVERSDDVVNVHRLRCGDILGCRVKRMFESTDYVTHIVSLTAAMARPNFPHDLGPGPVTRISFNASEFGPSIRC
jgi:hypothetical protein